jgi:hypothetical protein
VFLVSCCFDAQGRRPEIAMFYICSLEGRRFEGRHTFVGSARFMFLRMARGHAQGDHVKWEFHGPRLFGHNNGVINCAANT